MHLLYATEKVSFKIKPYFKIVVLLVIPMVLLFLPADFFDYGKSICPSKRFLKQECPGCGLTRGVMHTIHLEFKKAWGFNKLTFIVLPLLMYYYAKWILQIWANRNQK